MDSYLNFIDDRNDIHMFKFQTLLLPHALEYSTLEATGLLVDWVLPQNLIGKSNAVAIKYGLNSIRQFSQW